jgi:hypothetical protein
MDARQEGPDADHTAPPSAHATCPSLRLLAVAEGVLIPTFLRLYARLSRDTVGGLLRCLGLWVAPLVGLDPLLHLGRTTPVRLPEPRPLATGTDTTLADRVDATLRRLASAGMYGSSVRHVAMSRAGVGTRGGGGSRIGCQALGLCQDT